MDRRFRAIAIVVALVAIAVVVISHRDPGPSIRAAALSPAPDSVDSRVATTGMAVRAVVITSPKVAGQVSAGSYVDIWIASKRGKLHRLYRHIEVLAANGGTITVRAKPVQALKLAHVMGRTNERLVLRLRGR